MTGADSATVVSMPGAEAHHMLERFAPDLCRLLADPGEDLVERLRTLLEQLTIVLGADDACIRFVEEPEGEARLVATSERAAHVVRSLCEGRWFGDQLTSGARVALLHGAIDLPPEADRERQCVRAAGLQALIACSLHTDRPMMGVLAVLSRKPLRRSVAAAFDQLDILATLIGRSLPSCKTSPSTHPRPPARAIRYPGIVAPTLPNDHRIIGDSDALRYVLFRVEQVAPTNASVLLLGETGTGKELIARAIHERSPRRHRSFIVVNCGALPPTLIESELFGRERGAFTGAHTSQAGRFELANGGTLFLDEIGELPVELQPKLLRMLQEGQVERLGSTRTTTVDVRVVAASNRNLGEEVKKGHFRRDLYYRLNVFPITMPALRERKEDLPALVRYLVDRLGSRLGKRIDRVPTEVMRALERHDWPGNIRELENVLQQGIILAREGNLELGGFGIAPVDEETTPDEPSRALVDIERGHILRVISAAGWRLEGSGGAAQVLGLRPSTLRSRMRKLGIQRPK